MSQAVKGGFSKPMFETYILKYSLLNDKNIGSKYLILGPGVQRTFRLSSRTPRIPFNVLSRI